MSAKISKSDKIRKMLSEGKTVKAIAKAVKTSPNYVYYVKWNDEKKAAAKKPAKKVKTIAPEPEEVAVLPWEDKPTTGIASRALDTQVGGDHYKYMRIQPVEFILANDLGFLEGCIVKRICRWGVKGGIEDLQKIKHEVDLLIEQQAA